MGGVRDQNLIVVGLSLNARCHIHGMTDTPILGALFGANIARDHRAGIECDPMLQGGEPRCLIACVDRYHGLPHGQRTANSSLRVIVLPLGRAEYS